MIRSTPRNKRRNAATRRGAGGPAGQNTEVLESRTLLAATPFDVTPITAGQTPVTLYPVESVPPNQATRVSFGVPFPTGFVTDATKIRLMNAAGAEQAVSVSTLTPWRDLGTLTDTSSVRSALVQANV